MSHLSAALRNVGSNPPSAVGNNSYGRYWDSNLSIQGLNNIYCAPNKLFDAPAGLPVVATDQPPLRRLLENYGIGRLIGEHDSPEQIAEVIREVAENKKTYVKALTRFLTDHRWEEETERVREAIVSILTDKWRRTK